MKRLLAFVLPLVGIAALAAEPLSLRLEIHGRTPLHKQPADRLGYGLPGTAVFVGEPVVATVTALNVPKQDAAAWPHRLRWVVTSEGGEPVTVAVERAPDTPVKTTGLIRATRPDAMFANFRFGPLPPGSYLIALDWNGPSLPEPPVGDKRLLSVYRGDEGPLVRSFFLREQARTALADGTPESYQRARTMLLEAAKDNTDPSYLEELADASAPWAPPEETAGYYQRALAVLKTNLEKNYGPSKNWPAKARSIYEPRVRKAQAFNDLIPYYRERFADVRVLVEADGQGGKFVVERRRDHARLRVIDPVKER